MAAAMAAASSGEADWRTSMRGRPGCCLPLRATGVGSVVARARDHRRSPTTRCSPRSPPRRPSTACATASWSTRAGEWQMPPKVYLDAPPTATSARCRPRAPDWRSSSGSPRSRGNPEAGLPVVMGMICVSSALDGRPLALVDVRAITALRTGAVAAVAAQELAREDARSAGIIGCGLHGAWAARCLAAAEYGPGVCFDPDPEAAGALAGELGWEAGSSRRRPGLRRRHLRDPRAEPVVGTADLRPGLHLNMLGADGPGKAEAEPEAVARGGAVLRRVGPGQPRRRAHRRVRGRAGGARAGDRAGGGAHRRGAGPLALRTRSRSSTPPGSRYRTWHSASPCSTRIVRRACAAEVVSL